MRELARSVLPGAAAVTVAVLAVMLPVVREALAPFLLAYPFVVPGVGALLAATFRKRRAGMVLVVLGLAAWALTLHGSAVDAGGRSFAFGVVAVLLPANVAVAMALRDRGVFVAETLAWALVVTGQVATADFLWKAYAPQIAELPYRPLAAVSALKHAALPPLSVALFAAAFLFVAVRLVMGAGAVGGGVLFALVAAYWALAGGGREPATPILLAGASLAVVVSLLAAAVARVYEDELTGLPGRRALEEALDELAGTYTVALVDVDHFKRVNDRYGHPVGDQVLRMVGARLAEVGGGGRAYRYGGEEFALLFQGRTLAVTEPHLEGVRAAIAASPFLLRGSDRPSRRPREPRAVAPRPSLSVTVSIGAAQPDGGGESSREVLERADAALYRAKRGGRNRVAS